MKELVKKTFIHPFIYPHAFIIAFFFEEHKGKHFEKYLNSLCPLIEVIEGQCCLVTKYSLLCAVQSTSLVLHEGEYMILC